MEIAFSTKILREICENEVLANQELGMEISESLKFRLADLRAVERIEELPIGNPVYFIHNNEKCVKIGLHNNVDLCISANHNLNPRDADDLIEWGSVSRIKILSIGDNYDECII